MKRMKWLGVLLVAGAFCTGVAALLAPTPAQAGGKTCWQVDCNTCCRSGGGPVVCTQRACV